MELLVANLSLALGYNYRVRYKNIFILSPGRSGSKSIFEATSHITNYISAYESRAARFGSERFDYPEFHIEADNRLCWFFVEMQRHIELGPRREARLC